MKVTIAKKKEFLKDKLSTSQVWATRALIKIFEYQTTEEQNMQATVENNGVGFTGIDAEILSSFANQYLKRGSLSEKQLNLLMRKMPKYWKQIMHISDTEKLEELVRKEMN